MSRKIKISVMSGTRNLRSVSSALESFNLMKNYWREKFDKVAPDNPDYVVLPEACDRFLDMSESLKAEYSVLRETQSPAFFNSLAKENDTAVVYNTKHENRNTTFACSRSGELAGKYIKTFPMTTEMEQGIIPGEGATVFKLDSIDKAGFATCFDLNFEELREEYVNLNPEVVFFNSMYHGGLVQKSWAYSTRSFFVSSICGRESAVMAPNGRILAKTSNYTDYCTANVNLDCELIHLDFHWDKLNELKKKYGESVSIDDIGYLGSVLVSCEMNDKSIDNLMEEFEMIKLDDYLNFARQERKKNL